MPDLKIFRPSLDRGRSRVIEALWLVLQEIFVASFVPGSAHRVALLRLFGARIAEGVVIKPRVRVKFPWRLVVGAHSWVGENVWIDNIGTVTIGSNCCLSQEAYLCTGNHRWDRLTFDLEVGEICIQDGAWIGARCVVAPGAQIGAGTVLTLNSVAVGTLDGWAIYRGNPAVKIGERREERETI